jgi:peroxiredoxin
LAKLKPEIEASGARIVVLTMGQPDETAQFCGERAPGIACYADPSAAGYKTYGLARGSAAQMFGPAVWLQGALVTVEGSFDGLPLGKPVGDPWQMPGVFVIGTDGKIRLAYYSKHAGDYPTDVALVGAGWM